MKQLGIVMSLAVADDEDPLRSDFETQIIDALEGSGVKLASMNGGEDVALNLFLIPALQLQFQNLEQAQFKLDRAAEAADNAEGTIPTLELARQKADARLIMERVLFGFEGTRMLEWLKKQKGRA